MSLFVLLLAAVFGLLLLGFGMYWTAEFLGLRVEAHRRQLSTTETEALNAKIAALQADVDQLRSGEARIGHLEEKLAFVERLLDARAAASALPPGDPNRPGG